MSIAVLYGDALERDRQTLAMYRQLGATDSELARISRAFKASRQMMVQQMVEQHRKEIET